LRQQDGPLVSTLRRYFTGQPDVLLACLFGSQSRGSAGRLSDVDVAIVLDGPQGRHARRRDEICADLMGVLHRNDVDVVLADRGSPLLRHRIARDGAVILARGPHTVTRFAMAAVRDYIDTAPLRRLQEQYLARELRDGTFGQPPVYRGVGQDA
jgi:predicted nucleotidyltransferase